MKIRKKVVLVLAIAATQAVCLAIGVVAFDSWLSGAIRSTIHDQILADNVQSARQLAKLIRQMGVGDPRTDAESWRQLQDVVTDIRLPNDGYVCLLDAADGALLCHPMFTERPKLPVRFFEALPAPADRVTGEVKDMGYGLEIVAAAELPEISSRVSVHQTGAGVDAAIARFMAPVRPIGLIVALALVGGTTLAVVRVVRSYENRLAQINENLEDLVDQRTRSLMNTRNAVIFGLAKLAESRDTDTGQHLERIRCYVSILAKQLQRDGMPVDEPYIEMLGLASSLHDVGKVGVPDAVLLKSGRLDAEERAVIETHAKIGGDCLQAIGDRLGEDDFLQTAKEIAYGHHERWDGEGYPFRVRGESIPLSARITAVADVYDALRSRRPYKEPMPHERAKEILLEGAGAHFDPVVIEAFVAAEEEFLAISEGGLASSLDHVEAEERDSLELVPA
ncbi:MAG: HD domain-containing phosphohydrolase [Planctomycetota bacterium]